MGSRHRSILDEIRHSKAQLTTLFLDDGGVLNDNRLRGPEWLRLIGEFMPARLGGSAEQWASANRVVFPQVWSDLQQQIPEIESHQQFQRVYATRWMSAMCATVGVTPVPDDDAVELYKELSIYVGERANSEIQDAADAVRSLHRAGYTLYMASGTPSWELQAILAKMGVVALFSGFYGPDLVDQVKYGTAFYQRVFDDAGVTPETTVVIESDPDCCQWASAAGARAIWVDAAGQGDALSLEMLLPALV